MRKTQHGLANIREELVHIQQEFTRLAGMAEEWIERQGHRILDRVIWHERSKAGTNERSGFAAEMHIRIPSESDLFGRIRITGHGQMFWVAGRLQRH